LRACQSITVVAMSFSKSQLKFLRGKCHALNPVILVGQKGLTAALLKELDIALDQHELVKIKIAAEDRETVLEIMNEICDREATDRVQVIGKTLTVFRRNSQKPVILLPKD
jgi:RNA-binding protein